MRTFIFCIIALAMLMFSASPSFALSIDRDSGVNTDGTAKFADPDDQMPNFMTGPPEDQAPAHATPSVLLPMSPGENTNMNLSVNHFDGQQPDAFNQAFQQK